MAKRKRKMTLFDVINSGQPIGIQVRQRVPTYQPTPELPVKKKLAKLFGRSKKSASTDEPLSAAQELELLRRELGGKPDVRESHSTQQEESDRTSIDSSAKHYATEQDDSVAADENDPTARFFAARSGHRASAEPARQTSESWASQSDAAEVPAHRETQPPRAPRKPFRVVLREAWGKFSPHVERARAASARLGRRIATYSGSTFSWLRRAIDSLRNINTQHAATLATAVSTVVVLGGAFYVGKMLLQRPAPEALVDGVNTTPRPDVMDVDANSAVANVSRSIPEVALAKAPAQEPAPQPQTNPGVFGGRNLDLNFVIVQSYYTQAEADAAVDVLAKYGIRTTVEKNLPGWRSGDRDFFSVVSADGYARMKDNAVYQAFLVTLAKISDREMGSTLPKRLDPRPYKYVRSAQ